MSSVTDDACWPRGHDDSRNDYGDYERACREAGEPLCFETRQPIAGKDIKYVGLRWDGPFGARERRVPVIGHDTVSYWSGEDDDDIKEVPADYDQRSTTCPNCGCRFLLWNNGLRWRRRSMSGKHKACTYLCARKLEKEHDNRLARERRERARGVRDCAECGETFTPKRTDSVYCSNACRQKAYRQRVTDNARGAAAPSTSRNGEL